MFGALPIDSDPGPTVDRRSTRLRTVLLASLGVATVITAGVVIGAALGGSDRDGSRLGDQRPPGRAPADDGAAPNVTYDLPPGIEKALAFQGVRIDGRGDDADTKTSAAELFSEPGEVRPDSVALVRMTDTELGQLRGPDGRPIAEPGPGIPARVTPTIDHRLVWIAVYRDAVIPIGGSYVETLSEDGSATAPGQDDSPTTLTTDLYVIRDAETGEVLSGGSLNSSP